MAETKELTPLPIAAKTLGWSWSRTYKALLTGELVGERRGTRWYVTTASLADARRHLSEADEPAPSA